MARTAYFAPGVYVEEVPSAQQPIAGVGTNTAAFIGLIPEDVIKYPVLNDKYDPVIAKKAIEESPEITRRKLEEETQRKNEHKGFLDAAKADFQKAEAEATADELNPAEGDNQAEARRKREAKKEAQDKVKRLKNTIDEIEKEIKESDEEIKRLSVLKNNPPQYSEFQTKYFKIEEFPDADRGERMMDPLNPTLCTNFSEYTRRFGWFSADDPDQEPGTPLHAGHRALTHAVNGFFKNGGTKCFVVRIQSQAELEQALEAIESIDAVAIVAAPGLDPKQSWKPLVDHCDKCEDRFAVLDSPAKVENEHGQFIPLLNYDTPIDERLLPDRGKNAAYYFPHIKVIDPAKQLQDQDLARGVEARRRGAVYVAPSGHIAGIYARTDEERGVHKAPANVIVRGAMGVKYYVGKPRQELLNPQGVNCIRDLNGAITVWGARTIGGDKNGEWKYLSVRRLFLFLRESIDEGTQWVVFEPNDRALWGKIRRNVSAFLTNVWRSGALFGSSPQEAFYVKCDDETNPPEVRDVGQVVTEIGVAIVRPAEFVIFRIAQSTPGGTA